VSCSWPFHNQPGCKDCETWEAKFATNLDVYLETLIAAKAQRRKDIAEVAAKLKTIRPTETA